MGGRGKKNFRIRRPKGKNKNKPTAGSSSLPPPPWIELPRDVTANILRRLGALEILENTQFVCSTWKSVCREPSMWRIIDIDDEDVFGPWTPCNYDSDSLCRLAVDLSQGELIDIRIKNFGCDDLLAYISDRSSRLKRLTLGHCYCTGEGLTSAIKKLPELEELHLYYTLITSLDITAITISCPGLKSFTFNSRCISLSDVQTDDSYAMAIAKNMPDLRHLQLFGNRLTDEGLKAVLDGCPRLESLDLRQCFHIEFQGDLKKRCVDRIKKVKLPYDSTVGYEWGDTIYIDEDDIYGDYDDMGLDFDDFCDQYYEHYGDYEDYDDYTNPFNDLPFPANMVWYMDDHVDFM